MRFLYPLLFLVLIGIIGSSWYKMVVGADPNLEAIAFMKALESGDLAKTVKHFGSNVCRCPHKGGWGAYLIYASGQEPNLAFITGHPFDPGKPTMFRMTNNVQAVLPWQKPEDTSIDMPISFQKDKYAPLFLPLKMAYGQSMSSEELNQFLSDPDKDAWKGLTLRFRPTLKAGAIAPPAQPLPPDAQDEFKDLDGNGVEKRKEVEETDSTEEAVKKTLGADKIVYFHPRDPGAVLDDKGQAIGTSELEAKLPRLKSAAVRLHVVRRGAINEWTIYHFGVVDPVLQFPDGHVAALTHYLRPKAVDVQRSVDELKKDLPVQQQQRSPSSTR